jgi:hypothetical protein
MADLNLPKPVYQASGGLLLPPIQRPVDVGGGGVIVPRTNPVSTPSPTPAPAPAPVAKDPAAETLPTQATNPFKLKDGKVLVNRDFLEQYRGQLEEKADQHGFASAEDYLAAVASGATKSPQKGKDWSGKTVGEISPVEWSEQAKMKAAAIAKEHGMTPEEFMSIIRHESAGTYSPEVTNSIGATGIIQFLPTTAASYLLMEQRAAAMDAATSPEAKKQAAKDNPLFWQLSANDQKQAAVWGQKTMANLPVERQLDLADLYITDRAKGKKGLENVYTAIFAGNPNEQEFKEGTDAYKGNKGLDKDKDGTITREEWTAPVKKGVKEPSGPAQQAYAAAKSKKANNKGESSPTSPEEAEGMKSRAARILSLASPGTPRADIDTVATVVNTKFLSPGTEQNKFMTTAAEGKPAAGLYWQTGAPTSIAEYEAAKKTGGRYKTENPEDVWVSKSVDKPTATGVLAHEYGHALKQEHTPTGLMSASADDSMADGWSGVIKAAATSGGDYLNKEQQGREEALFADVPDFLRGPLGYLSGFEPNKPSESFSQSTMEASSGESPFATDSWQKPRK